jgi:hypothetical protein
LALAEVGGGTGELSSPLSAAAGAERGAGE